MYKSIRKMISWRCQRGRVAVSLCKCCRELFKHQGDQACKNCDEGCTAHEYYLGIEPQLANGPIIHIEIIPDSKHAKPAVRARNKTHAGRNERQGVVFHALIKSKTRGHPPLPIGLGLSVHHRHALFSWPEGTVERATLCILSSKTFSTVAKLKGKFKWALQSMLQASEWIYLLAEGIHEAVYP